LYTTIQETSIYGMPTEKAAKKLATNKVPRRKSHTDVSTWSIISFPILFVYRRFAKNTKYRKIKNMWTQHIVDLSLINVGQIKYITKTDVKLPVIGM